MRKKKRTEYKKIELMRALRCYSVGMGVRVTVIMSMLMIRRRGRRLSSSNHRALVHMATEGILPLEGTVAVFAAVDVGDLVDRDLVALQVVLARK